MAGDTKRINRGRGHSYVLDGDKAPGVTTILNDGLPKPALVGWAAGTVGEFVADRLQIVDGHVVADEVLDDLAAIGAKRDRPIPDWREHGKLPRTKLADAFKGLPYADRDAAGNRGTEVHQLARLLAEGEEVQVPDELLGHVDAYLAFRRDWEPVDEIVEFSVINRQHHYMGTGDVISRFARAPELGLALYDIKTNRSGPFGEVALQLAGYRYAETMLTDDGETPMPEIDWCGVLWLRADGYDLYPYEAGQLEFRQFLYVQQVAHFCTTRSREVKGDALRPPITAVAS